MDGPDLLNSQLTSESCPWDLKGFYLFYSHIHVYFFNSLSDFTYVYVWNKWRTGQILLSLVESMLCTDKTWLLKKQQLKFKWYSMVNTIVYLYCENKTAMVLSFLWSCSYCICLLVWLSETINVSELALFKPVSFVFRYRAHREEWL